MRSRDRCFRMESSAVERINPAGPDAHEHNACCCLIHGEVRAEFRDAMLDNGGIERSED